MPNRYCTAIVALLSICQLGAMEAPPTEPIASLQVLILNQYPELYNHVDENNNTIFAWANEYTITNLRAIFPLSALQVHDIAQLDLCSRRAFVKASLSWRHIRPAIVEPTSPLAKLVTTTAILPSAVVQVSTSQTITRISSTDILRRRLANKARKRLQSGSGQ